MKIKLLIGLLFLAVACTAYQEEFYKTIDAIWWIESRCGQNTNHTDGESVGDYGLKKCAVDDVNAEYKTTYSYADRYDPIKSREIAFLYLCLMKKRFKCDTWLEAAGRYHSPGNELKQEIYITKIKGRIL